MNFNLAHRFAAWATQSPQNIALSLHGRDHTYAELAWRAQRVAGWVASRVGGSARVGIIGGRSLDTYLAVLGSVWAGATYVPLNPKFPRDRLAALLKRADLAALIVDASGRALLNNELLQYCPPAILALGGQHEQISGRQIDGKDSCTQVMEQPAEVTASDPVYIMFTSGTTGEPKGVVISAGSIRHFLDCMQQRYKLTPQDRLSQLFELSFDASLFDLFMAWDNGASTHVIPDTQLMAPGNFIKEKQLTLWFGVPSSIAFLRKMNMLQADMFPTLRFSIFGGEPLPVASVKVWQQAAPNSVIDNIYGPTEATVTCFVQRCSEPLAVTAEREVMAIGKPHAGMQGAIIDADGHFLPHGEVGEIILAGPQLAVGYWQDPTLTASKFRSFDSSAETWYCTGDIGYADSGGVFHHLGRMDNQVKVTGYRVELEEVESHLRELSESESVVAVAWPLQDGVALGIVAFLSNSRISLADLKVRLAQRVPMYMMPKRFIELAGLPYTLNGKIDRRALVQSLDTTQS